MASCTAAAAAVVAEDEGFEDADDDEDGGGAAAANDGGGGPAPVEAEADAAADILLLFKERESERGGVTSYTQPCLLPRHDGVYLWAYPTLIPLSKPPKLATAASVVAATPRTGDLLVQISGEEGLL